MFYITTICTYTYLLKKKKKLVYHQSCALFIILGPWDS